MKLVAEFLTGRLFYVEVEEDATVADLKRQIENQENVLEDLKKQVRNHEKLPSDPLILMLDANERYLLDKDEVRLKDFGVEDDSHIYIFFRALINGPWTGNESPSIEDESPEDADWARLVEWVLSVPPHW